MIYYDIQNFIDNLPLNVSTIVSTKDKLRYLNIPCAFDIETSSCYDNGKKVAFMYVWQLAIENNVMIGRTWKELRKVVEELQNKYNLPFNTLVIYVHNLGFEFQFMRKRFNFSNVFANYVRKPIKAYSTEGIEFRCSYFLSGYSLATLAKNLTWHDIKKLEGNLDYEKIRTSKTKLTEKEIAYCVNDVLIIIAYIEECLREYENIANIPLTSTGKVRRYIRKECLSDYKYKGIIRKLTIEYEEIILLKQGFQGGFTHANVLHVGDKLENVSSYDFTSSYPTIICSERFPMSKGKQIKLKNIQEMYEFKNRGYTMIFDCEIYDVVNKSLYEQSLSYSRCRQVEDVIQNNGRIVRAKKLKTVMTDIDFQSFNFFYKYRKIKFGLCYIYKLDFLPKKLIECSLQLYKDKTELKGVNGKESEYLKSKGMLNSIYGMCVTDILRNDIGYIHNDWYEKEGNFHNQLERYNEDKNRFLFYPWGVWITAYARRNLFSAIKECKEDYVYSDTDSVKIINANKHINYFNEYNEMITYKIKRVLKYYNLDLSLSSPKTIENIEKPLGVWDFEGIYKMFKTLGAKRYIYTDSNNVNHITIAGVTKKAVKYIFNHGGYDFFTDNMYIPCLETGKMTHTYIDNEIKCLIKDYQNNYYEVHELSSIHLENSDYNMNLSLLFVNYLFSISNKFAIAKMLEKL